MELNEVISKVAGIRGGTMVRISYKTELPIKAAAKKEGIRIVKFVESTVRIGVNYDNIKSVIERKRNNPVSEHKESNYTWIIKNRICANEKTGSKYMRIATVPKNSNTRVNYFIETPNECIFSEILTDSEKELVQNSYWAPKPSSEVRNIKIENIIWIGSRR